MEVAELEDGAYHINQLRRCRKMYEYEIVTVPAGAFSGKLKEDYKEIIHDFARRGWRLKQIIAPPFAAGGQALQMDIIFERKVAE